jgi:hypothetical protein
MAYTLFDAAYRVARELGIVTEGLATGGSTTTIVDTNDRTETDDFWNSGSAFILSASGAAPEGEFSVIKDFVNSTSTVTVRDTLGATVASGDKYALGRRRYPLYTIIQNVNKILTRILIEVTDKTTLDTVAATEYSTAPIAANLSIREVWIQGRTGDADDNRWIPITNWRREKTATGTADLLIFDWRYPQSRDILIKYIGEHGELANDSDTIDRTIHMDRIVYPAVVECLNWRKAKTGHDRDIDEQLAHFMPLAQRAIAEHYVDLPARKSKLLVLSKGPVAGNEIFKTPSAP